MSEYSREDTPLFHMNSYCQQVLSSQHYWWICVQPNCNGINHYWRMASAKEATA